MNSTEASTKSTISLTYSGDKAVSPAVVELFVPTAANSMNKNKPTSADILTISFKLYRLLFIAYPFHPV
jgi:hypothetical protein